uniref:MORN repeat-containing protein 5 n=2 Tax=Skeletonema marinoi TaxID=267567 RepID=A0A7S2LYK7_9STRA|mmetsp:Transcript_32302/g.54545  ORF Transcript_32302/g.54545 Transcript_32302/m.54545 type:complete len:157 (+) Transcript_32302:80-550(+)
MKYKDGSEYDGEWAAKKMHGRGKYTWPDGAVYVGEFAEGKQHGAGTFTSMWQLYRYQGGWRYGKRHGKGERAWFWNFFEFEVEFGDGQLVHQVVASTSWFALLFGMIVDVIIYRCLWRRRFGLVYVLFYFWMGMRVARRVGRFESDLNWVKELKMS